MAGRKKKVEPVETGVTGKWLERINKNNRFKGKAQVKMACDVRTPYALRRPTGIPSLDVALGGGIHAGGAVEIFGAQSAGKTFMLWTIIAELQKIYGSDTRVIIYSSELRPDKGQARLAGCAIAYSDEEIAEMELIRTQHGMEKFTKEEIADLKHQIGDIVVIAGATAEDGLDVLVEALREGIFQIAAIDSLGALLTKQVEEGSVGDSHYAGPSRIITQFQNQIWPLFSMDRPDGSMLETTLIGINQVRSNIGAGRFDRSEKAAMGAWSWKHGQLLQICLTRGGKLRTGTDGGPIIGHKVRWSIDKGKAGTHDGKNGEFKYFHFPKMEPVFWKDVTSTCYGGIGIWEDMIELASDNGMIAKAGSWMTLPDGTRVQGGAAAAQHLADNPDLGNDIYKQILKKNQIMVRYS